MSLPLVRYVLVALSFSTRATTSLYGFPSADDPDVSACVPKETCALEPLSNTSFVNHKKGSTPFVEQLLPHGSAARVPRALSHRDGAEDPP